MKLSFHNHTIFLFKYLLVSCEQFHSVYVFLNQFVGQRQLHTLAGLIAYNIEHHIDFRVWESTGELEYFYIICNRGVSTQTQMFSSDETHYWFLTQQSDINILWEDAII